MSPQSHRAGSSLKPAPSVYYLFSVIAALRLVLFDRSMFLKVYVNGPLPFTLGGGVGGGGMGSKLLVT